MRSGASRAHLRLVEAQTQPVTYAWFCGRCGAAPTAGHVPAPHSRVCASCHMGVMLEGRADAVPEPGDPFVVVDSRLHVQAVSAEAERMLGVREEEVVERAVSDLMAPADAESAEHGFAALLISAAADMDAARTVFVRPADTFGVRIRARVSSCGPPRAALVVLDGPRRRPRLLHSV